MKVPLDWLKDYVDIDLPVAQLAERLTLAGLELASVRLYGLPLPAGLQAKITEAGPVWDRDKVVIAEIVKVERHPDADKLTLPQVRYGEGKEKQLVTGAPNIKVGDSGQKVVLALTGAKLFDGHAREKKIAELKPTKIRGVPSDSMVCSLYELGVSEEHEGIVLLDPDAPVGMPLADYMGDIVLELDVLPNMARCLSMIGVAREVAALTGKKIHPPPTQPIAEGEPIAGQVQVAIEDANLSARYTATLLRNVRVGPSPTWLKVRLTYAGMRPINNVVDITNYVMLEWGQPLHAFDHDKLVARAGGKAPIITVRPARPGETLVTLDGVHRELTPENLVIADEKGPIALAGVMGGLETEVSEKTTNVLLESASFHFLSIRRTMKALNLPSEASARFSRGVHPELVPLAAGRAAAMMQELTGARVCQGIVDCYPVPCKPQVVELKMAEVRRLLGLEMPLSEAVRILEALEFQVERVNADTLRATVPPHRLDIQEGPADLIEDLARIYGYDRLPATLLAEPLPQQRGNRALELEERVRDLLAGCGLQEAYTYSLTIPEREEPLGLPRGEHVKLLNPISSDRVVMRRHLLPSLLEVTAENLKHTEDVRLFEIGFVYLLQGDKPLPDEPRHLSIVMTGRRHPEFWADAGNAAGKQDFFDLKGVIESLVQGLHLQDVVYRRSSAPWLHPGQAAELHLNGEPVGSFGVLHPRLLDRKTGYDLGSRIVLAAELDLEAILRRVPARFKYRPFSYAPPVLQDIAIIVDANLEAEKVVKEIWAAGGELLREVRLFDVYRGEGIPPGKKSLAYALTYQADDRTLTDKEVSKAHKKIEDRLRTVLKASIRGEDAL